jgi:hypothetical protein
MLKKLDKKSFSVATFIALATISATISACGKHANRLVSAPSPQTATDQELDAATAAKKGLPETNLLNPSDTVEKPAAPKSPKTDDSGELKNPADTLPFVMSESYLGEEVTLIYPHARDWGYITLRDADAQALYDALNVKVVKNEKVKDAEASLVWLPGMSRTGYQVKCYKQAKIAAPEAFQYACTFYINYRTGAIDSQTEEMPPLSTSAVKLLKKSYLTEKLALTANNPLAYATASLHGDDARALYTSLNAEGVASAEGTRKMGKDYDCIENAGSYACTIRFSYRSGAVQAPFAK